ncbi:MAG: hypothetical protein A3J46_05980 [Candidatus Yanofskybacteria bacterium RIFCSPHIGHO2_02_FULL_41_11]|uniref:DNA polymerase III subunit delta n=1 Tax=Candidatus Yanofskybacteria bacterium RIFCSPHIGHO2_02_FULL_41_11 TaxID=1802675 RepID=A0A1F8FAQ6_9BACT|nr:MAG: hypothetical protein A3J46_05980 [Candidatus Yanofskybacteria bacterium RIFCSPHIGHO2_02_FULL_41_11]
MVWSVVGHDKNKKYFQTALKDGYLSHAYLFSGPEMIGKKLFAKDLVDLLNNRGSENNPDFISVGHSIENIRDLKSFLYVKPYYGPYKLALIDEAEKMTAEASNALLKILEEPSSSTVIILVSSKPKLLLPTIWSRCQEIKFQPLMGEDLISFLPSKLRAEDKNFLKQIASGRPGWIIKNAENAGEIRDSVQEFDKILKQGIFEKIQYAAKVVERENQVQLISDLIYWYSGQENKQAKLIKNLIQLSGIVSQSQYNHRLALENFLINSQ